MNLFLIVNSYPDNPGELFLDNELRCICTSFEQIYILTNTYSRRDEDRFIPPNGKVIRLSRTIRLFAMARILTFCLKPFFVNELIDSIRHHGFRNSLRIIKVMLVEVGKALVIRGQLEHLMKIESIEVSNTVFYSYWLDYKALALALMRSQNPGLKCVSRAHGWDVFRRRQAFPYLPFKSFTITHLQTTFSASEAGKRELLSHNSTAFDKIQVARLGCPEVEIKSTKRVNPIFCSCSSLIPVKRIHLIAEILKHLGIPDLKWVHFGDGPLMSEIMTSIQRNSPELQVEFMGFVSNKKVLEFYAENYTDLFINVSASEGIPVSIMEALAAGIPVVATDVGGVSEIVKPEHGFLIEKDFNAESVAARIADYLDKPDAIRQQYRQNAASFWKQNYSSEVNYLKFAGQLCEL